MIEDNMKPGHEHNHGIGCHQTHKHQQQHKGKPPSHKNPTVQKSSTNKLLMNYLCIPTSTRNILKVSESNLIAHARVLFAR